MAQPDLETAHEQECWNDPSLTAAPLLLDSTEAALILAPAVAVHGGDVQGVAITGLRYQPSRRLAVRYRADIEWGGRASIETAVLLTQKGPLPDGVALLENADGERVGAWLYPWDPYLPGLPSAASPDAVRALLASLGSPQASVAIRPRVYRPTSRAVLQVTGATPIYLRVMRPEQSKKIHDLHREAAERVPVPAVYGHAAGQGIVVLKACPGRELGAALVDGQRVPPAQALFDILDRLADLPVPPGEEETPASTVASHRSALTAIVPQHAERVREIAARSTEGPWEPDRTVHGDFYEAQVLVHDGRVTSVLDLDRVRRGDRVDDAATLLAHLDVAAWARPSAAHSIRAYREEVAEEASRRGPRDQLFRRVAGALLGLAAWPFRAQHGDWASKTDALIDLASRALEEVDECPLTSSSPRSHGPSGSSTLSPTRKVSQ